MNAFSKIIHRGIAAAAVLAAGLSSGSAHADVFIKGDYVEAGIHNAASFGSSACAPAGFHSSRVGCNLGFIADFQKDGWTVGTPGYAGDYFLPGSPYEGWVVEWRGTGGVEREFTNAGAIGVFQVPQLAQSMPAIGMADWTGRKTVDAEQLDVQQKVSIPLDKGYMLVEVTLTNTGSVPMTSVEYLRGVDPDQGIPTGGAFDTLNWVEFQAPRAAGARPALSARPAGNTKKVLALSRETRFGITLGLGTVDTRAVAASGVWWPIYDADRDLNSPVQPTPAAPQHADLAMSLSFDLGNLGPGESTTLKFAYVLSPGDLDDAFAALAPTLDGLVDQTLEATSPAGAVATYTVTANDPEDGAIAATCTPASGSSFPLGSTTVSCSATDSDGNETTGSFIVTVRDTTSPTLSLPADITAEATGPSGRMVSFGATASDLVSGSVPVTCTPASGSTFTLGTTPVNCSASDAGGNGASGGFNVSVVDTTPPALTVPTDITREATSAAGATATFTASASDLVSGSVTPVCTPLSGSVFALGTTLVTCTATDAAGNSGSAGFNVKVQDTTPPALSCPANLTGVPGQTVTLGDPTVSDAVDATPTLSNNAPGTFPPGLTTVTWTARDDAGNSNTCQQTVTLRYTFQGFFQPVDNLPVVNTVKGGSTVPVKWRLVDANGANVTDTAVVTGMTYVPMACGGSEDAIEQTVASGGTTLRWDGTQFIYNWKTPATPGKCLRLNISFNDGTTQSANFKLK